MPAVMVCNHSFIRQHLGSVLMCNRKSVIVGAGYIAVELAGILQTLGSDVSLLIRYDKVVYICA